MGCVTSKDAVTATPARLDHAGGFNAASISGRVESVKSSSARSTADSGRIAESVASWAADSGGRDSSTNTTTCGSESVSFRLGNLQKYVEAEQAAAGWPTWLSAVASEAIQGWIPLRPDSFEKLEKIGQGTYSSVFRARDHDSGKIVALKKIRFDSLEPESVRFMSREILILRRLDHPNIIKLEGIITSRLSSTVYLVFEYMDHDLSGLSSSPDINFTEPQVKCYMKQLLSGLEHCHSRGVMHRDIKSSNLLINNKGILKVADFGLANFNLSNRQPMTSRVVTLWYRPPELLLGATNYTQSVDLWSVGCVFAELLLGKPLLQGRTEVEQLHKIFKLCGSPPDEYWNKSRLPHATLFKPQQCYVSCLNQTCKDLPTPAFNLIHTLLSVEPSKRGTASSALASEYFATKPYACDPSSLPKYPPNKEIDAKCREEARKKRVSGRAGGIETLRKASRKPNGSRRNALIEGTQRTKINGNIALFPLEQETTMRREGPKDDVVVYSGPIPVRSSSGFAWAKKRRDEACMMRSYSRLNGSEQPSLSTTTRLSKMNMELRRSGSQGISLVSDRSKVEKAVVVQRQWSHLDSFDDEYHSQELSMALSGAVDGEETVEFSGSLMLSQSHKNKNGIDELLERHELHVRQALTRS